MDLTLLHLISLIITIPVILYADHMGFNYLIGKTKTVSVTKVKWAHALVFIGLGLLIVTGILVTVPMWAYVLSKPIFYLKMAFVITLLVNGLFIGQLMKKATEIPFVDLSKDEKLTLIISGGLSASGWFFSAVIGYFAL